VAINNSLHYWKAQAASVAARGKHGVEDTGSLPGWYSGSRIFNRQENVASCDSPFQANLSVRGGLAKCIQHEVQQHPVQQLVVSDRRAIGFAFNLNPNLLLLCDRLKKSSHPFEQPGYGNPFQNRHDGPAELKYVCNGVVQQTDAPHNLFGVFALHHGSVKFDAPKRIPDFVSQLHSHLAHNSELLQLNTVFAFLLELVRERLNSSLKFAIGTLQ
jgi:hypothetical protein